MRAKAKAGFAELGGTVRSFTAQVGAMSGGQRQQIAIVRAISWADKIVFLDEPTAALGVVQTKNVLDTIKRVRDKGIAVVLISHSMPHVLEVADRVQVMRLGTRVATLPAEGTTVEQLVGAMTGALDFSNARTDGHEAKEAGNERHRHTRPDDPDGGAGTAAIVDEHTELPVWKRLTNLQSVWILGVLLVIVRVLLHRRRREVPVHQQLLADLAEHRGLGRARRRHDLRHHHLRHRPVRRLGARLLLRGRRQGHGRASAATAGATAAIGILAALVSGVAWGMLNGFLVAKAKIPPLIVTLGSLSVALGLAQVITGGIDIRSVPEALTDFNTYIKIVGIPALPFVALVTWSSAGSSCTRRSSAATPTRSAPTRSAPAGSASTSTAT